MRVVMLDAPEELIAERARLGLDRFDEVWEGEYHMVPPPSMGHQELEAFLIEWLRPQARAAGLQMVTDAGVYDPDPTNPVSWRVPDLVIYSPEQASDRGVEGQAELVVEIRSPGDESYQKLPFYERVGVQEVLVIDRDTRSLRHWTRHDDQLVEADATGGVTLQALDAHLDTDGTTVVVRTATGTHRI